MRSTCAAGSGSASGSRPRRRDRPTDDPARGHGRAAKRPADDPARPMASGIRRQLSSTSSRHAAEPPRPARPAPRDNPRRRRDPPPRGRSSLSRGVAGSVVRGRSGSRAAGACVTRPRTRSGRRQSTLSTIGLISRLGVDPSPNYVRRRASTQIVAESQRCTVGPVPGSSSVL